jgi:hypothetical protein|tara:strand:+ start:61 stop:216 length:156 start_codon:yes stop_codon:yes gene_type:complete
MGAILGTIATKMLSEKVLISIVLKVAEWLVNRSSNDLDNKVLDVVKKALAK